MLFPGGPFPGAGSDLLAEGGARALRLGLQGQHLLPRAAFGGGGGRAGGAASSTSFRRRALLNEKLDRENRGRLLRPSSPKGKAIRDFQKLLKTFPLASALTAGSLSLSGDSIAQFVEHTQKKKSAENPSSSSLNPNQNFPSLFTRLLAYDWRRTLRMATYGAFLYAPGTTVWYHQLDRVVPGTTVPSIAAKVAANQLLLGPAILLVVWGWNYGWTGRLKELPNKARCDLGPSVLASFRFWLPATVTNFAVIPLGGRVAFMSACGLFWNFYLSTSSAK